jgi:hypothetical protein
MAKKAKSVKQTASKKLEEVDVSYELGVGETQVHIVGTSTLLMERFSQKAWRELLLPPRQSNRAERAQKLKHDPLWEFQQACYRNRDPDQPTLFHLPNGMLHGVMKSIGVDIPGAAKAEIARLTTIIDENICLFGIPLMHMAMVRNSGINRSPDVRTRPAFKQWAAKFTIRFATPLMNLRNVTNLVSAGGQFIGIGGWRRQKGGPFGSFRICSPDDPEYKALLKNAGRKMQQAAFIAPLPYDDEVEELFSWFNDEVKRRELLKTHPVVNDDNGEEYDDENEEELEAAE